MFDNFLGYISKTHLFGVIPLDMLAHFIGGIFIYLSLKKITKRSFVAFALLILIALLKEYYDSFTLNSKMPEHIKDIVITIMYPIFSMIIEKFKTKS